MKVDLGAAMSLAAATRVVLIAGGDELRAAMTLALAARAVSSRLGNLMLVCDGDADEAEDLALHLAVAGWRVSSVGAGDRRRLGAALRRALAPDRPAFVSAPGVAAGELAAALREVLELPPAPERAAMQ